MKKIILLCFFLLVFTQSIKSHPDGATPYWYPSDFIYGYINGCAESVEVSQLPFTQELWPVQVRTVCACVVVGGSWGNTGAGDSRETMAPVSPCSPALLEPTSTTAHGEEAAAAKGSGKAAARGTGKPAATKGSGKSRKTPELLCRIEDVFPCITWDE